MSIAEEERIERYVRSPHSLSDAAREEIADLLTRDLAAATVAGFFRAFYHDLEILLDHLPRQPTAFADGLFDPPRLVHLEPFLRQADRRSPTNVVLSAMSATEAMRFNTMATLAAPEEHVLVRVVIDRETNDCHLFVIAEDSEIARHALVSFSEYELDIVTDAGGRARFPAPCGERAWRRAGALLRVPVAEHLVREGKIHVRGYRFTTTTGASGYRFVAKPEYDATLPSIRYAVVTDLDAAHIIRIQNGEGFLADQPLGEAARVRYYN